MTYDQQFFSYILVVIIAFVAGLSRYRTLDTPSRIMVILLLTTLAGEYFNYLFAHKYRNNMPVYHVFSVIYFGILFLYFCRVNNIRLQAYWVATLLLIAFEVLNTVYFQPIKSLNSNFLIVQSFLIICMAMYSLYRILNNDEIAKVTSYIHFWFNAILLFHYCATYFYWSLFLILYKSHWSGWPVVSILHWGINILIYLGIAAIFIQPAKKTTWI